MISLESRSREPLGAWFAREGPEERRFELASAGDRVNGVLSTPRGPGPHPLLLAQHDLASHAADPSFRAPLAELCAQGFAIATIDFPLHGERASAKLSRRAFAAARGGASTPPADRALWCDLVAQGVRDLARALDALSTRAELDAARIAYVGLGLGASVGALYVSLDARIRAAVLAGATDEAPEPIRPGRFVARITPRPLLFLDHAGTPRRAGAEALHSAAREPKRVVWVPQDDSLLARPELARFLADALSR